MIKYIVDANELNLRLEPNLESNIIHQLKEKDLVDCIQEFDDIWIKVSYYGLVGYCSKSYLIEYEDRYKVKINYVYNEMLEKSFDFKNEQVVLKNNKIYLRTYDLLESTNNISYTTQNDGVYEYYSKNNINSLTFVDDTIEKKFYKIEYKKFLFFKYKKQKEFELDILYKESKQNKITYITIKSFCEIFNLEYYYDEYSNTFSIGDINE